MLDFLFPQTKGGPEEHVHCRDPSHNVHGDEDSYQSIPPLFTSHLEIPYVTRCHADGEAFLGFKSSAVASHEKHPMFHFTGFPRKRRRRRENLWAQDSMEDTKAEGKFRNPGKPPIPGTPPLGWYPKKKSKLEKFGKVEGKSGVHGKPKEKKIIWDSEGQSM